MVKAPRIMILGIDGASPVVVEEMLGRGELPVLRSLIERGQWGILDSTLPPLTPPAWTSFMTGVNPGKHGLYHFFEPRRDRYGFNYTSAANRRFPTIWRTLNAKGLSVGVTNVPMTYPPERVTGYMISGLDTPDDRSEFIYPATLRSELNEHVGGFRLDIRHLEYMRTESRRRTVLQDFRDLEAHRTEVARYLLEHHPVDVYMHVYCSVDQIQHYFWHYHDATHPFHDDSSDNQFNDAVFQAYRTIDGHIGELIRFADDNTTLFIMSDHGAGSSHPTIIHLNDILSDGGFLTCASDRSVRSRWNPVKRIDPFLRRLLPPGMKMKLAATLPWLHNRWESKLGGLDRIDWAKTKAFACEIAPTATTVYLNRVGIFPEGNVTEEASESILTDIVAVLRQLKIPGTDRPLIEQIYRKDDMYRGDCRAWAPDLLLSWWQDEGFTVRPSSYNLEAPRIAQHSFNEDSMLNWTGTHRREGLFIASGGKVVSSKEQGRAAIIDLAPTILSLMDCPVSSSIDGQVMHYLFPEGYLTVRQSSDDSERGGMDPEDNQPSEAEDTSLMEERLRALGYLS